MTAFDYVEGVRRRWALVLVCVAVGLGAGWVTTEAKPPAKNAARPALWSATSIIIGSGEAPPGLGSLTTLAALTKVGEVPARVAERLGSDDPAALTAAISAVADPETGLLTISSRADTRRRAEDLANEFATQLVSFQQERLAASGDPSFGVNGIRILQQAKAYPGEPILTASGSIEGSGDEAERRRAQLYVVPADIDSEDERVKTLLEQGTSWRVPAGHPVRLATAGGAGFFLGVALALLLAHYDTTIRSKRDGEAASSWPVLAEIPQVPRRGARRRGLFLADSADSGPGYAFRLLVAALDAAIPGIRRDVGASGTRRPRLILVTSPERGDGKTSVAVNLAAGFAEDGRNVLLMSCDVRNPAAHKVLGLQDQDGLVDAIESPGGRPLLASAEKVATSGRLRLRIAPTGKLPASPGRLLASEGMHRALAEARATADVVVLDASPVTTASDVAMLIPHVDAVVVVLRAGKTTAERVLVTEQTLQRLGAPVVGAVINRVSPTSSQRRPRAAGGQRSGVAASDEGYPHLPRHSKAS